MSKRPRSVTVISWIFIAFGSIALLTSLLPHSDSAASQSIRSQHPLEFALFFVGLILSVICGAFMLRGCNWARWLLVLYLGRNVINNIVHLPSRRLLPGLLVGLLFAVVVFFLFRPHATAYFHGPSSEPPQIPKPDETPVA